MRYFLQKTCDPVLRSLEKRELFISAHTRRERKGGLGTGITGARAASVKCQNLSIHSTCQNLSIGGVVTIVKSSQSQNTLPPTKFLNALFSFWKSWNSGWTSIIKLKFKTSPLYCQIVKLHLTLLTSTYLFINLIHFTISSDVLQDMRVNVFEEGSESVIWYKVILFFLKKIESDIMLLICILL